MNSTHLPTLRVTKILKAVSSSSKNGKSLTEISEMTSFPKSSILPILKTLCEQGFLRLNANTNRYTLGIALFELGSNYYDSLDVMEFIEEEMKLLTKVCEETSHFGILIENQVLYLKKIDSSQPVRMVSSIGKRLPAFSTGIGKALLSGIDDFKTFCEVLPDKLVKFTPYTKTNKEEIFKEIQNIKKENVVFEVQESEIDIRCIATPIKKNDEVVAALSVAVPVYRYNKQKEDLIISTLLQTRKKIENMLQITNYDIS